jgi:hypothetical protein
VRARVEAITFEALDVVERGIRVGTPAAQHNLITRVLPVLIKTVTGDQSTDSELDALKETQAEIMKALHESVPHPPDAANPGS